MITHPPLVKRNPLEVSRLTAGAPVNVVIHVEMIVRPTAAKQRAAVEVDDVPIKLKRTVTLFARAHDLRVLRERNNVVPDDVVPAVMLMITALLGSVNDVVLHEDTGAAFAICQPATDCPTLKTGRALGTAV